MDSSPISRRATAFHDLKSFTVVRDFIWNSPYTERYTDPAILDFTFGDPREMPAGGVCLGPARRDHAAAQGLVRLQGVWPAAQEAAAASLGQLPDCPSSRTTSC